MLLESDSLCTRVGADGGGGGLARPFGSGRGGIASSLSSEDEEDEDVCSAAWRLAAGRVAGTTGRGTGASLSLSSLEEDVSISGTTPAKPWSFAVAASTE